MIGQAKCNKKILPRKIVTENKVVTYTEVIAKHFNTFFTEIGPRLAKKIETPAKTFETYLQKWNTIQPENPLTVNELKDAFFSLQTNKSLGHDGISFNVIKNCFGPLSNPLLNIFNLSLEKGIFPDELKDYLRYVSKYFLFDPNIAIIYEKDHLYKHFSLVCLHILVCFCGHLC